MCKLASSFMRSFIIILCCIANSGFAFAASVENLYEGIVSVSSQNATVREQALQQALSQVLIKVSGNPQIISNDDIKNALQNPESYLLTYSYFNNTTSNNEPGLFLQVEFDPKSIMTILQNAHIDLGQGNTEIEVQLTVINVKDLSDYDRITKYLKGLSSVKQAELIQIKPSVLSYALTVVGGEWALQRDLSLDPCLQPITVIPSVNTTSTGLVYQWTS